MSQISQSSIGTLSDCERKWFYSYFEEGGGLVPTKKNLDLDFGSALHLGLETLLRTSDLDTSLQEALKEWVRLTGEGSYFAADAWGDQANDYAVAEHGALLEALLRGFHKEVWPKFVETYEILSIEEWAQTLLDPEVELISRWDVLIRDRFTGLVYVLNWKSAKNFQDWSTKWAYDIQAWTETIAAEAKLGESVAGCLYIGFFKGATLNGKRSNILIHPSMYVGEKGRKWKKGDLSMENESGDLWMKLDIWGPHSPLTLRQWVESLPSEVLSKFFSISPPVLKNEVLMKGWLGGVVYKQKAAHYVIANGSKEEIEKFFTQKISFRRCKWCPFKGPCFGETSLQEALSEGTYVRRDSSHRPSPLMMED